MRKRRRLRLTHIALVAFLGLVASLGASYAHALIGGPVHRTYTFAGTLTGTSGPQDLTFTFAAGALTCDVMVTGVVPDVATGAFEAAVATQICPAALLDDPQTTLSIAVGGTPIVTAAPIRAVLFARYAEHLGTSSCPTGYDQDMTIASQVVCVQGDDRVVRVGTGASAFWIDRYEASVWSGPLGTGTRFGASLDDYPSSFPDNGQWTAATYAASVAGVVPSVGITWFQADAACRASGKRLPTDSEWIAAARGTTDATCNITAGGPRSTGTDMCTSVWGAQDMVGNVWEWTANWFASANGATDSGGQPWPSPAYGDDAVYGVTNYAYAAGGGGARTQGLPAAAARGGSWTNGAGAGAFALVVAGAPSSYGLSGGFRCVIDR